MKWNYIALGCLAIIVLVITLSYGKKAAIDQDKGGNAAHDAFLGNAPTASKPYNILDYTKPAAKP